MRVYATLKQDDPKTEFKKGDYCLVVGYLSICDIPHAVLVGEGDDFATIPLLYLKYEQVTSA